MIRTRYRLCLATFGLALACFQPSLAEAQDRPSTPDGLQQQATETAGEKALAASAEARHRLESEIAEIRSDRAKLNAALIAAGERSRAAEDRVHALETRLETLTASESAIRKSLESRRGMIVEVFAAQQRMGRRPPPAVLVRPEDMLEAVRASILLGAVLPELRSETEALATDLGELV